MSQEERLVSSSLQFKSGGVGSHRYESDCVGSGMITSGLVGWGQVWSCRFDSGCNVESGRFL
jgi:hypothetical protein